MTPLRSSEWNIFVYFSNELEKETSLECCEANRICISRSKAWVLLVVEGDVVVVESAVVSPELNSSNNWRIDQRRRDVNFLASESREARGENAATAMLLLL